LWVGTQGNLYDCQVNVGVLVCRGRFSLVCYRDPHTRSNRNFAINGTLLTPQLPARRREWAKRAQLST
jgi:hypothetical protein